MDSVRRVIARAISIAKPRLTLLLGLAVLVFVPLGLLGTVDQSVNDLDGDEGILLGAAGLAAAAALAATTLLGQLLFTGLVAASLTRTARGESPSIIHVVREARWRTLVTIDLLTTLAVVVGFVLLIVPGIIAFARFALASTISDLQRRGVRESFRHSARLSRGHGTLIVGLLVAALAFGEALQVVLGLLLGSGFGAEWVAATTAQVLSNPVFAVIAVSLVLELTGAPPARPSRGAS